MIEWIKQNYIPIIMIVVIFMVISLYVLTANNRYDGNYNSIKNQQWHKISPEFGSVISNSNSMFNKRYGLKDYYILASYNSCIGGYLKNDFVDKRPLTEVIKKGARFLDFEIWNVDNEAVVAAGIENSETTFKGTFNHLPFNDVMSHVNRLAFNGSMSPNSEDPLFLLFRMKTKNTNIYNSMTKTIKTVFKERLLSPKYGHGGKYVDEKHKLNNTPLSKLHRKVIILCIDENTENLKNSEFIELVNYCNIAGNGFINAIKFKTVKLDSDNLKDDNKRQMCIVLPNTTTDDITIKNEGYTLSQERGCQIVSMHYGGRGSSKSNGELEKSLKYHNNRGSAFVLKPPHLREEDAIELDTPKKQDPRLNMAEKPVVTPMYKAPL